MAHSIYSDHRPALVFHDCENAEFVGWKLPASAESESLVRLECSRRVLLKGFELTGMTSTFARIEGTDSSAIKLANNKLGATRKSVELGQEVNAATILDQSKF
jgi:hypothetical protein